MHEDGLKELLLGNLRGRRAVSLSRSAAKIVAGRSALRAKVLTAPRGFSIPSSVSCVKC